MIPFFKRFFALTNPLGTKITPTGSENFSHPPTLHVCLFLWNRTNLKDSLNKARRNKRKEGIIDLFPLNSPSLLGFSSFPTEKGYFLRTFTLCTVGDKWMKIFVAAPLFSKGERDFNSKMSHRLREEGFEVWMAQETPFFEEGSHQEKKRIYECGISALETSDVVVAVLDGIKVDSGVAYELGFAKALGKPLVGLKTDHRTFSKMEEVNLMLEVPLIKVCENIQAIIETLNKIRVRIR